MDESFHIGVGPRTSEEEQYLLARGLLVEDNNGEYRDMSTIIDDSAEESFFQKSYNLPLVGVENINNEDFNYDSCDDKENIQPPPPSDNSYNERLEKNLQNSASKKNQLHESYSGAPIPLAVPLPVVMEELHVECHVQTGAMEKSAIDVQVQTETLEKRTIDVQVQPETPEKRAIDVQNQSSTIEKCSVEIHLQQGVVEEFTVEIQMQQEKLEEHDMKEVQVNQTTPPELENSYYGNEKEIPNEDAIEIQAQEVDQGVLEESLEGELNSLSISGVNNRSFTISVHETDEYERSYLANTEYDEVLVPATQEADVQFEEYGNEIQEVPATQEDYVTYEEYKDEDEVQMVPATQEDNFDDSLLSTSVINKRSFTISIHDSDAEDKSYFGKTGSSGDMDDTMTAIEKLLALADEEEKSQMDAERSSVLGTSASFRQSQVTNSSNLIQFEQGDVGHNLMETPVEAFLPANVVASSTGSRHIETPKSRENKNGRKKSENLMYFSPTPQLVPKRILDLKKKGKFFSPSPPRPLPNANPPRGIRQQAEEIERQNMLTPVQFCGRILKSVSTDKKEKKKTPSANNLYADVNSPVKEYIYGRATPASLLKSKSTNIIRSLPVPQQKPGQGFRTSTGISSITRIPKPKSSISSTASKLSIGRTSVCGNQTRGEMMEKQSNIPSYQPTGIPKPSVTSSINKFQKENKFFEGAVKMRAHNDNDDTLSSSQICESALRHTGLRNESGNASLLQGNYLKKQYYPGSTPITANTGKRNIE